MFPMSEVTYIDFVWTFSKWMMDYFNPTFDHFGTSCFLSLIIFADKSETQLEPNELW